MAEFLVESELSAYEIERNKPMPNLTHGIIQALLVYQLMKNYENQFSIASEVTLNTSPEFSTPDIIIDHIRKMKLVNEEARMSVAPLATIEIQSPSQSPEFMVSKLSRYFEFGVKSCWIVFPALKAIVVYQSQDTYTIYDKDEILKDPVLEIQLEVGKIFQ